MLDGQPPRHCTVLVAGLANSELGPELTQVVVPADGVGVGVGCRLLRWLLVVGQQCAVDGEAAPTQC